jgi:membrane-associated phospholipid phosphatase
VNEPTLEGLQVKSAGVATDSDRKSRPLSVIFKLRIEEFIALLFFGPMVYFTAKAYFFFRAQGHVPRLFMGDVQRVLAALMVIAFAFLVIKYRPQWTFLRDTLPFLYCLAIYTNLHDTIHFANPRDIHYTLIAIDQWLFGAQPSVWMERFIHPWLTEIFSFCYWFYFALIPLVAIVLYLQKRRPEFRETLVSTVLCFYSGYFLYVIFPAVSPNVVLKEMYTVHLNGTPLTDATMRIANSLPSDVRDAFPSLHTAITILSLLFAWKYVRWLFWALLPVCIGLLLSTVYLRHHYVIDLPAGILLGILAFKFGPGIDGWWRSKSGYLTPGK